ncbi:recombinase family protein [Sphingomonas colocasiae]|uniref:Recombinase family protein n=1 Tax=Sphingomonas colocasiae TaxID=1848973 RepID=A0ABS7PR95_9SPHN|nr:recombinase family protein [Sphingomonas colocasiae]MBY8823855.1 recombinase family protein [Sphingomonas colocasiae]
MQIVTYLRVSTAKQGMTGLGMEAQRSAVEGFAASGGHRVVAEFVEVESGKKTDRPQLEAALAACRLHRATLVIAKLDRLARNVAFIANLMDGGVEFVACDMPYANRLTLHLMAAMAEHEREMISQRTKAALAAAKARGVKLGNPNGAAHLRDLCRVGAANSGRARRREAVERALAVAPLLDQLAAEGVVGARAVAAALNRRGVPSPSGGLWYPEQVRRAVAMLAT